MQSQARTSRIKPAAVGKFQNFMPIIVVFEIIGNHNPLLTIIIDKNPQAAVIVHKFQVIKSNTVPKADTIIAQTVRYHIQTVTAVIKINVVAFAAFQPVVALAAA